MRLYNINEAGVVRRSPLSKTCGDCGGDELPFWKAIKSSPGNWEVVLQFAQWLAKQGRKDEAKALRWTSEHEMLKLVDGEWRWLGDPSSLSNPSMTGWYEILRDLSSKTRDDGWGILNRDEWFAANDREIARGRRLGYL